MKILIVVNYGMVVAVKTDGSADITIYDTDDKKAEGMSNTKMDEELKKLSKGLEDRI